MGKKNIGLCIMKEQFSLNLVGNKYGKLKKGLEKKCYRQNRLTEFETISFIRYLCQVSDIKITSLLCMTNDSD